MHRALLLLLCLSCAPASPAPREPEREPPVAAPEVVAPRRQPALLATNDGGARSAFFVRTDGTDACGQPVTMRPSTTLGSGHAQTAIIAGGATGYDEYRVSCGQQALPERRIALYR